MPGPESELFIRTLDEKPVRVDAKIVGPDGQHIKADLAAVISSPSGNPLVLETIINGNALNPHAALVSSPPGESVVVNVDATVNGGVPLNLLINKGEPLKAEISAIIASPMSLNVGLNDISFKNFKITLKLFGLLTLFTVEIRT